MLSDLVRLAWGLSGEGERVARTVLRKEGFIVPQSSLVIWTDMKRRSVGMIAPFRLSVMRVRRRRKPGTRSGKTL